MFTSHPSAKFGGITIAERAPDALSLSVLAGDSDERILSQVCRNLPNPQKAAPTRAQFGEACRKTWPRAAVFVGGHHVAVHFNADDVRNLLFTGCTVDWN
jgi:mitochondrial fission protein ELM1